MCAGWQVESERQRGVCFDPYLYISHLTTHFICPSHLFHHNISTLTANASKMAGRLFTYCKELVGIYPDSTEAETETDTDSSTSSTGSTDSPDAEAADSPEAKVTNSPDAKAATDVKPDDNGTAATAASNDDAKVEQVNLDIASGSQQESTTQADIEAWHVAELARLEAKLATSDARLIGLAADLAWADCVILKKEQEHSRLYGQLSSLHEACSKRHEELTKQNQELERVVEESVPGVEADMALLLLYLSRAAVDISGTAKQDAERFLRRADQQWEAYKQGYPLDDEGDASDVEGAE
jgi:hypothetical protein